MSAAAMLKALEPVAHDGNPYAALYVCRLKLASDPDAEAERIVAEITESFRKLAPLLKRLTAAVTAWVEIGLESAEVLANRREDPPST